jgi:hypothetical protein
MLNERRLINTPTTSAIINTKRAVARSKGGIFLYLIMVSADLTKPSKHVTKLKKLKTFHGQTETYDNTINANVYF